MSTIRLLLFDYPVCTCSVPLEQYVVSTHMLGESIQAPMNVVMFSCAISRLWITTNHNVHCRYGLDARRKGVERNITFRHSYLHAISINYSYSESHTSAMLYAMFQWFKNVYLLLMQMVNKLHCCFIANIA